MLNIGITYFTKYVEHPDTQNHKDPQIHIHTNTQIKTYEFRRYRGIITHKYQETKDKEFINFNRKSYVLLRQQMQNISSQKKVNINIVMLTLIRINKGQASELFPKVSSPVAIIPFRFIVA